VGGTLNNCLLQGNTAGYGGGAEGATLNNCLLIANNAYFRGSDAIGTLNNCTVVGGGFGGTAGGGSSGLENSKLTNCILKVIVSYTNCTFSYCCVSPLPPGPGNIASDPQFVDAANGNYHLSATSPCLNAGTNAFAPGTTDLDGNPRILNSVVDMGAYETLLPPVSFSLAGNRQLIGGAFQLSFSNVSGLGFTVFGSTNVALPSNLWSNLGPAVETPPASGNYQFTDPQATNKATRFYRVRSP
jgi:hypothetical protein